MAECTVSRCSHERRIFRKELHKWNKEILFILGLERLAEELMGARKWKILVQPFSDLENQIPTDWFPEDTCYFCSAKKQPPYDPASGFIPTIEGYNNLNIETDEHTTLSDQTSIPGSSTQTAALSPWQIAALTTKAISDLPSSAVDQPLDLSINSLKLPPDEGSVCSNGEIANNLISDTSCVNSLLKVPQIPLKPGHRRRLDNNSKRSYTEDELQAALRDIQSGKLGTRRAAVIYGIPRSTLRNKVYKLANESKSRTQSKKSNPNENAAKSKNDNFVSNTEIEIPFFDCENNKHVSSASESLRQLLKHTITQKGHSTSKSSEDNINCDSQSSNLAEVDATEQLLKSSENNETLTPILSHMLSDINSLLKSTENESQTALKSDLKLSLLPDLIRRLAEERMEFERVAHNEIDGNDQDDLVESHTLSSNVILKVPSFKPAKSPPTNIETDNPSPSSPPPGTSSHSLSGNKGITVTLKELISRSISQKINCGGMKDTVVDDLNDLAYISNDSLACNTWNGESPSKEEKESRLSSINNSSNSSDSSKSEKRTRPKRGRYRNYDRDNLARAVRAVQKGEMSVHRAGTFYGVPHSTLEYKVKERHLLRPRKKDLFNVPDVSDHISSFKSDSIKNSFLNGDFSANNNTSVKNLRNLNQIDIQALNGLSDVDQPHRPSIGSYPSPLSLWQNLPFLSLDFSQLGSNNFIASQMMRKLQENARIHEETQKKRKNQDFSIIENLITSTLERSISPESKSSLLLSTESIDSLSECKKATDIDEK